MFVVGKILKPHGFKGEVCVYPTTDEPARFKELDMVGVSFEDRRGAYDLNIEHAKLAGQFVLVKFKGVDSMEGAEKLRGGAICIDDAQALPLGEDEYYVRDLYDMPVVTEDGERLGAIADVLATGANDVYVVRRDGGGDVLIPAVKAYILSVDPQARVMKVHLAEGML